ncbi:MAG TPA: SpoIIE family protein phosphatase [Flavobacteriales bacterium]|nr:SpoIIE family protein phosphatase [Flavobacteriales bacterium]
MRRLPLILAGILVLAGELRAQYDTLKFDSLVNVTKTTRDVKKQTDAYIKLSILLEASDFKNAIAYSDTALALAKKTKNKKAEAEALISRGNVNWYLGEMEKVMADYLDALNIREKINDVRGIGVTKYNLSLLFNSLGNNKESLRYALESQEEFKKGDFADDLCMGYIGLYGLYLEEKDSVKSMQAFRDAEKLVPKLKDKTVIASFYLNKGAIYVEKQELDKALENYLKSYEYSVAAKDNYGITKMLNNIGLIYSRKKDLKKAIEYTLKAVELGTKSKMYLSLKYSWSNLAKYYNNIGDYQNAYEAQLKEEEMVGILYNQESQRLSNEMEARFQDERKQLIIDKQKQEAKTKDAKIAKQDEENKRINQQRIFIGLGLTVMIFVSLFIFRNLQRKKRDNAVITKQKEEIAHQKEEIEEKHTEIKDSIDYAKRIQNAMLTTDDYWAELFDDYFVLFQPKDVVSGDFYWAFETDTPTGKLVIWCVADCTGHGVPGAFMSMLGISFLNEIVVESGVTKASEILEKLRERIIKALVQKKGEMKQRDGMDIALCVLNKSTNEIEFAGANNPLWIIRKSTTETEEHKPDKMPVGQFTEIPEPFHAHTIQVSKGDMVYVFSDGFADQFGGPAGKKLRVANFKLMLGEMAAMPAPEQAKILAQKFADWKGSLEQVDDVCVVGVRI